MPPKKQLCVQIILTVSSGAYDLRGSPPGRISSLNGRASGSSTFMSRFWIAYGVDITLMNSQAAVGVTVGVPATNETIRR